MRDTNAVGNVTEAMVLAALARLGKRLLVPFGQGQRYDLLIDEGTKFVRVQCKTGKLKSGCVLFKNFSRTDLGDKSYGDSVDAYGVYCPQNGKTYFVPASDCTVSWTTMRIDPPRNGMRNLRYAATYEI